MPESDFDKQVQREMEGLRLRPSSAVWENVEKELRRKKRRRYAVFFWLLAGLGLLGYFGYLLVQNGQPVTAGSAEMATTRSQTPVQSSDQPDDASKKSSTPANMETDQAAIDQQAGGNQTDASSSAPALAVEPINKEKNAVAAKTKPAGNKKAPQSPPIAADRTSLQIAVKKDKAKNKQAAGVIPKDRSSLSEDQLAKTTKRKTGNKTPANTTNTRSLTQQESGQVIQDKNRDLATAEPATPAPLAAVNDTARAADSAVAAIVPPPVPQAPIVKKAASPKLTWSLDFAAGVSGPISSPFMIGGTDKTNADVSSSPNMPNSPINPPGSFGPVYVPRSDINPGPAFRIGILGEWAISKRTTIGSGLQYQYQSNNMRIGFYQDTAISFSNYSSQQISVRAVYRGPQQKTFTNRYHYLQVPITFQWRMNPGKKLPVLLNAGVAAGYLLTSNALVYDSLEGGIYYHDKNALHRFQFSVNTGLSFRFGGNKLFQWSIGPEVSMGLRSQVKKDYDKKQYPLYFGIQGRIYWPKSK